MTSSKMKRLLFTLLLGVAGLLLALRGTASSAQAGPAVITVCQAGSCDYDSIQAAVDNANTGDVIKVAAGNYEDVHVRPRQDEVATGMVTQVVYLSKTLTIQGGYTTTDWLTPHPEIYFTTLNANQQGRVFYVTGDIQLQLFGLQITGGNAQGQAGYDTLYDAGGGLYVFGSALTLEDSRLMDNHTAGFYGRGGGLAVVNGTAALHHNVILSNTSTDAGGVFLAASQATFDDNHFEGNGGGGGGALWSSSSLAELIHNTLTGNHSIWGGGLYADEGSTILLTDNIVTSNTAFNTGGGLSLVYSDLTAVHNTIADNIVDQGCGGGLYLSNGSVDLKDNLLQGNQAQSGGGLCLGSYTANFTGNRIISNTVIGLFLEGGQIASANDVVADNVGDGIVMLNSSLQAAHLTIARNQTAKGVAGFIIGGQAVLTNVIVVSQSIGLNVGAGDTATVDGVLWFGNDTNWSGSGVVTVTHAISGDPAFALDGYHLLSNSLAIDHGVATAVNTDIDGQPRPYRLPDLGADEYWPVGTPLQVNLPVLRH